MKLKRLFFFITFFLVSINVMAQDCDKGDDDSTQACPDPANDCKPQRSHSVPVIVIRPADPNEIIGNNGYDTTKKWVSVNDVLGYKIFFENDPDSATAAAQNVTVYLPLPQKIDPGSFRLGDFGFGSFVFLVPPNTTTYTNRLDVSDSLGVLVDVTAGLDVINNRAYWIFQSIDTATGLSSTLDVFAGFLPINDTSKGNGEGFVSFTAQPFSFAQTRDTTQAQARIVFDTEASINTNVWLNTIDAVAPASKINPVPPFSDSAFVLSWNGKDDSLGAGIRSYTLYVSENGGPFAPFRGVTDSNHLLFTGRQGSTYGFFTRATDHTGNREAPKQNPDQTVTLTKTALRLQVKAWLHGAYQQVNNLMTDSLRTKAYLPAASPYVPPTLARVNNPNTETVVTGLLDSTGSKAITDWVWLELRSATDNRQVVSTRSALIRRDGMVTDMDGVSPVYFTNMFVGNYYVVLRHRNHFGVMTASPVTLNRLDTAFVDFTNTATLTYGTNAQRNVNGTMMLWEGNANGDGLIRYNGAAADKNEILRIVGLVTANNVVFGYHRSDINLDGMVKYNGASNDKNKLLEAVGLVSANNVIAEQLPK